MICYNQLLFRVSLALLFLQPCAAAFGQRVVAVIGGGMAGVSTTHFISQYDTEAQIHLFEKESQLGGNAQTVQVTNSTGTLVSVDAGPQYFADGPWADYLQFLDETISTNSYTTESMKGTVLIQRKEAADPILVSPLGWKLRGEKLGKLLRFKRFNAAAYELYLHPEDWRGVSVENWVESLDFERSFKDELIYPFLAASLGTNVSDICTTSAADLVKLFAFRKPKASNTFHVVTEGMGTLIQRVGEQFPEDRIHVHCSSPVERIQRQGDKWLIQYDYNGRTSYFEADFVVLATHADQALTLLDGNDDLNVIQDCLSRLTYFKATIALHTDASYTNEEKPAFLNIITNAQNDVVSSTMNLGMISDRLAGIYKSWLPESSIEQLRSEGKLLHVTTFWHPLITTDFIRAISELSNEVQKIPNLYLAGGWSEGLETQNSAVQSGKHAAEKYASCYPLH